VTKLRVATRKSKLALWQANWVKKQLETAHSGVEVALVLVVTKGDKILDVPLAKVGGKGLFVKEIEDTLLRGEADLAVHSMKDVPAEMPEGLHLPVICEREDPRDAWLTRDGTWLQALTAGACVGTSSLRRKVQLLDARPDLRIEMLRGNVDTRLRKLDEGNYDAIVLAAAGLKRLELADRITAFFEPEQMLPAVGQGAVGIESRIDDEQTNRLIAPLHHQQTAVNVQAERAFLARLEGGCQVPIGCHAVLQNNEIWLRGLVGAVDGTRILRAERRATPSEATATGRALAEQLLDEGAADILEEVYESPQ
jgi:hydroxymethylbilane synthase